MTVQVPINIFEKTDLETMIQIGVQILVQNMHHFPAFDPSEKYEQKNYYMSGVNEAGIYLLRAGYHASAEKYYSIMAQVIRDFENEHSKPFNKGIVYANLGIAQIRGEKFDTGIANLLQADKEDEIINKRLNLKGVLDGELWKQFELPIIFDFLVGLNDRPAGKLDFSVDSSFLSSLFEGMDYQDRIFLQGNLLAILNNLKVNKINPNSYSSGRLFSGLQDICLLTETLLRKHQNPKGQTTIYNLLCTAIHYPQEELRGTWSVQNLQEFINSFEKIEREAKTAELRRAHCLNLVRNFTGHHFSIGEAEKTSSGQAFFDEMYEVILDNVIANLLHLKHISAI